MATLVAERPVRTIRFQPVAPNIEIRGNEWFVDLYESTCESVYRFALMLMRDPSAAEDVAAEVYLRAWRARDRFEERGTPVAWVLSITRNCALDELRKRRQERNLEAIAEHEDPTQHLAPELSENDVTAIHGAIRCLTREQQQVIFLRFYEELPHESVALKLGRNPNAVRAIQFRALSRLRKLLEESRAR
jgi:RNA polymerase sigma-70 factor (ECF subfamily)